MKSSSEKDPICLIQRHGIAPRLLWRSVMLLVALQGCGKAGPVAVDSYGYCINLCHYSARCFGDPCDTSTMCKVGMKEECQQRLDCFTGCLDAGCDVNAFNKCQTDCNQPCSSNGGGGATSFCRPFAKHIVELAATAGCAGGLDAPTLEKECDDSVAKYIEPAGCDGSYATYLQCAASATMCDPCRSEYCAWNACMCKATNNDPMQCLQNCY